MTAQRTTQQPKIDLMNSIGFSPVLTEADLQDMDEADYMCDLQLNFFRVLLVELKASHTKRAIEHSQNLMEADSSSDLADRATAEEEHAVSLRSQARELNSLLEIDRAIIRIDAGDYGWCTQTGEPIGIKRLLAQPTATLTVEVQQRQEKVGKYFAR